MKQFLAASLIAIFLGSNIAAAPLEEDAVIPSKMKQRRAQEIADEASRLIHVAGYRCDTVSVVRVWAFSPGFTIMCNGFRYEYEIEDRGGRWAVTLK